MLHRCPFCGRVPSYCEVVLLPTYGTWGVLGRPRNEGVHMTFCSNPKCGLCGVHLPSDVWNVRPIEAGLRAKIEAQDGYKTGYDEGYEIGYSEGWDNN